MVQQAEARKRLAEVSKHRPHMTPTIISQVPFKPKASSVLTLSSIHGQYDIGIHGTSPPAFWRTPHQYLPPPSTLVAMSATVQLFRFFFRLAANGRFVRYSLYKERYVYLVLVVRRTIGSSVFGCVVNDRLKSFIHLWFCS